MTTLTSARRSWFIAVCIGTLLANWVAAGTGPRWAAPALTSAGLIAAIAVVLRSRSPQVPAGAADQGAEMLGTGPAAELAFALAALDAATEQLTCAGQVLGQATDDSGLQSRILTAAAQEMLNDVSAASSMSEELAATTRTIAADAAEVARSGGQASALVEKTSSLALKLGESSNEIESVLRVIGKIAGQTNMLALNATIEAARSGEAGKTFKVVANEVKELSRATDTATKNIEARVQAMQTDSNTVVEAIEQIAAVISGVNDAQATIAASVERTASGALDQRLGDAVSGAMAIAMNLDSICETTNRASLSAAEVLAGIDAVRVASRLVAARLSPAAGAPSRLG